MWIIALSTKHARSRVSPRKRERERFRPNCVGQSIKREERREKRREKIKNDSPNFNSTPFFIIGKNKRMNVGF